MRNWFFDIGILKTKRVGVPVISVGNISAGGVGKTPVVEMFIERLTDVKRIAVVSRGYGRKSKGLVVVQDGRGLRVSAEISGDEPAQIAVKYPHVIVIVDERRVRGAQKAIELGANIILLDDGFQHRYLFRDLNVVVMTADEIMNGDWLLPVGNRRETISSLKRADAIIVSRCTGETDIARAGNILERFGKPITGVQTSLKSVRQISTNVKMDIKNFQNKKIIAVSGIGNPKSFEQTLRQAGANILEHVQFPDHHWFSEKDIRRILESKKRLAAEYIVTTEKDSVRLLEQFGNLLTSERIMVAEIQQDIIGDPSDFDAFIKKIQSV